MTTYNTGNPIGSKDPRDLYDNAENFDTAVNSNNDTFVDRLGKERPTLKGGVDPSGLVQTAVNAKNDALTARDAAFVNADVYDDIAAGLAAVADGEQFQVVEGDEIVRYRNESGSAVEVARYPAPEFVRIALDVASQPAPVSGEFYADDDEQPVFSITDRNGKSIASWRHDGTPILPWRADFYTESSKLSFAWHGENGKIFYALDKDGSPSVGGGLDASLAPSQKSQTEAGQAYKYYGYIQVAPSADSFFRASPTVIVPTTANMYSLLDDLAVEFPDYITKSVIGSDVDSTDINQYRATPPSYWTRWYPENQPASISKPKVILFGANHGNEKRAALTNYKFLREICLRWREDERLAYLRWGMDLVLIPVLNPSGFDANYYLNGDGVNINRNFPTDWATAPGPSYKGPSPVSEPETQAAVQVLADHADACAVIDHHNAGSLNNADTPYAYWIGTDRAETIEIARMSCDHMMMYLRKEYDYVDQSNTRITRLVDSFGGTLTRHAGLGLGLNSFTLEGGIGFASEIDTERYHLEGLTNLVYNCVRAENMRRIRDTQFS